VDGRQNLVAAADFDPEPSAAAAARRFVRDTLISSGLPVDDDAVSDAVLLTSELVTNAVVHAGTPVQLTCRLNGTNIEVSVLDRHPARVIPDPPGATAVVDRPSGRGLLLPAALSASWGVTYAASAKAVWFRLGPDAGPDAGPDPGAETGSDAAEADAPSVRSSARRRITDLLQLGYDELLGHAVELARDASAADAAYALIADEDGELRMRAAVGGGVPQLQADDEDTDEDSGSRPAGMATFLDLYNRFSERGTDLAQVQNEPLHSLLTVPLAADSRVIGMLAVASAEPDRFAQADLARVQDVADRMAVPLERARLAEHDRIRRARLSFLAEASDLLAGNLDQEKTVALAAQLVVPRLAAWCAALLPGEDGELSPAYVWHADESLIDALTGLLHEAPAPQVRPGEGPREWSLNAAAASPRDLGSAAAAELASDPAWCLPLVARDRSLGIFLIGRPREGALAREAVELAEDLTRRVALALDNARLYSEQLQATNALQRSLLPPELPDIPGVELAAGYEAAGEGNEVGGDFYDVFEATPGRWRFAIGDVCGKGPEAAAVTGLTRHALRILAREGHDVPTVLERLNALIVDEGSRARFITLIHGELRSAPASGEAAIVSLVCAGHPQPLVLRSAGGVEAVAEPQPLLGVLDGVTFEQNTFRLSPGDVLLCVTDGVTERRCDDRLLDDDDGLRDLLGDCPDLNAGSVVARIQRTVREFGPDPPTDDLALLVFRGL
jgi:serine phosphatase RsbU (regulator of sigma subunit)/anti-sigma regulatory factor (Ser/Thr protein kinase)